MLSSCKRMSICFANSVEEPFEPPHDKPTIWLCGQRRLRSAWASAQSDQSLRCPHEERLEPKLSLPIEHVERTAKALKCPRLNLFETFNVIAIKLVVILNHFPGDKTVFYGLYLTLVFVVTVQSDNIAHIRILMVMHDSFKSITG